MHPGPIVLSLLLLSSPAALAAAEEREDDGYVSLEQSVTDLQALGDRCPIRVEMPVPEMKVGGPERIIGVLARYIECDGVRISHVEVELGRGPNNLVELSASATVIAPKGEDSTAKLMYYWVLPSGETHRARQYMHLDEGEINWEDAATIRVPGSVDLTSLRLRVEMTSPAG